MAVEEKLRDLLRHFSEIYGVQGRIQTPLPLEFEAGPHSRPTPLRNERGVYLFFQGSKWLRIGQTGYAPRFTSQYYGTRRAGSTFAQDIWLNRNEFGYQGEENDISEWLFDNFGRTNIRISVHHGNMMSRLLEAFLHLNLNPRFEGRREVSPKG